MAHPDLPAEQAHLDRALARLEAVRAQTQEQLAEAFRERGGTFQSFTERDIRVRNSLNRLEKLQLGREALIFGRIDANGPFGLVAPASDDPGPAYAASADSGLVDSAPADATPAGPADATPAASADIGQVDSAPADATPAGPADATPAGSGYGTVESFHIGRLALSDADHEPLVVDWRAPVAEPFYRATGAHPMGLRRRRHFLTAGRRVLDLEDELFAPGGSEGAAETLGLSGSSVLMAALRRAHTGRMRDIVATVQAEQDEIIRAPLSGVLVVQGGPGTGKTAVALHRAAYLLYTHRFPLEGQGVLVVGPNPTFLRYIDQVLPSLGETGVELSTATGLYRWARPTATESPAAARLKGDPRMARFVRRAVLQRERPLRKAVQIPYGRWALTLSPEASAEIVAAAKRRSGPHNARRRIVETLLWQHLWEQLTAQVERWAGPSPTGNEGEKDAGAAGAAPPGQRRPAELGDALRRRPEVVEALERMWPRLTAEGLWHDLLGAKPLIDVAAGGILSPGEAEVLYRPRSASEQEVPWTPADIPLLDEASWLLGPLRHEPVDERQPRTHGHIVVDEVQDLTPMELRMVGRRSLSGSMTLVGDIAQATGPWAPGSWNDVVAHLPARRGWRMANLSVSYRAPSEVMELAAAVLAAALPGVEAPEPVRQTGQGPRFLPWDGLGAGDGPGAGDGLGAGDGPGAGDGLGAGDGPGAGDGLDGGDGGGTFGALVARTVNEEVRAVVSTSGGEDGSVGVLVPAALMDEVRAALDHSGVIAGEVGAGALDVQVSLLALTNAKGLEFDSVVVVEPARIVSEQGQGLRALYVALTRCTRRLAIVYREALPEPLAEWLTRDQKSLETPEGP
jgi:DNA helicase IV